MGIQTKNEYIIFRGKGIERDFQKRYVELKALKRDDYESISEVFDYYKDKSGLETVGEFSGTTNEDWSLECSAENAIPLIGNSYPLNYDTLKNKLGLLLDENINPLVDKNLYYQERESLLDKILGLQRFRGDIHLSQLYDTKDDPDDFSISWFSLTKQDEDPEVPSSISSWKNKNIKSEKVGNVSLPIPIYELVKNADLWSTYRRVLIKNEGLEQAKHDLWGWYAEFGGPEKIKKLLDCPLKYLGKK